MAASLDCNIQCFRGAVYATRCVDDMQSILDWWYTRQMPWWYARLAPWLNYLMLSGGGDGRSRASGWWYKTKSWCHTSHRDDSILPIADSIHREKRWFHAAINCGLWLEKKIKFPRKPLIAFGVWGCLIKKPKKKKADDLYQKVLSIRLLCCII